MKNLIYLTILSIIFLTSCLTPKEEPNSETTDTDTTQSTTPQPKDDVYVVSEEVYEETFVQVDDFVVELNQIISRGNFAEWKTHLSQSYIDKYGDKEFLKELSENPGLKDFNIKLKSLRDYFKNVVVPSRSKVKIDEIQFVTEDQIKVYTLTNNSKFVVYQLKREGSKWIITE